MLVILNLKVCEGSQRKRNTLKFCLYEHAVQIDLKNTSFTKSQLEASHSVKNGGNSVGKTEHSNTDNKFPFSSGIRHHDLNLENMMVQLCV